MIKINQEKIEPLLTRRVEKTYPSKEALKKVLLSGKKLRIYQGFDPSTPNLHLGHLVGLLKLKEFQDLGHEVIFLIGDFTAMIGDPTGKLKIRKALTKKQVLKNAQTYQQQAGKILKFTGKNPIKIKFNSSWLGKLKAEDLVRLTGLVTVQQMIARDMFQKRLKNNQFIFLNEFLYPLLQAYDSVAMAVDIELGGSDQMFNMLVGRDLMKKLLDKEKFVLTTELLVDSQGNKIGKTEGNAINLINPPEMLFGQIMSLADDCILPCFKLITQTPMEEIKKIQNSLESDGNPMIYKKQLSFEIVKMLNNQEAAEKAREAFEKVFEKKSLPEKIKTFKIKTKGKITLKDLLVITRLVKSRSEAKRLINQGAVEVDQKIIKNPQTFIILPKTIKVGKRRFLKVLT